MLSPTALCSTSSSRADDSKISFRHAAATSLIHDAKQQGINKYASDSSCAAVTRGPAERKRLTSLSNVGPRRKTRARLLLCSSSPHLPYSAIQYTAVRSSAQRSAATGTTREPSRGSEAMHRQQAETLRQTTPVGWSQLLPSALDAPLTPVFPSFSSQR